MMIYRAEYTDTFGGQANYAWVRVATFEASDTAQPRELMRHARKALGLEGVKGRIGFWGYDLVFRPYGMCTILFITPID